MKCIYVNKYIVYDYTVYMMEWRVTLSISGAYTKLQLRSTAAFMCEDRQRSSWHSSVPLLMMLNHQNKLTVDWQQDVRHCQNQYAPHW